MAGMTWGAILTFSRLLITHGGIRVCARTTSWRRCRRPTALRCWIHLRACHLHRHPCPWIRHPLGRAWPGTSCRGERWPGLGRRGLVFRTAWCTCKESKYHLSLHVLCFWSQCSDFRVGSVVKRRRNGVLRSGSYQDSAQWSLWCSRGECGGRKVFDKWYKDFSGV